MTTKARARVPKPKPGKPRKVLLLSPDDLALLSEPPAADQRIRFNPAKWDPPKSYGWEWAEPGERKKPPTIDTIARLAVIGSSAQKVSRAVGLSRLAVLGIACGAGTKNLMSLFAFRGRLDELAGISTEFPSPAEPKP